MLHLHGSPWHGHAWWLYKLIPGIKSGNTHSHVIQKGDCIGYRAPFSPSKYTPQRKFPSFVQEVASSTLVSYQNALTSGETPTSHTFPFGHCHHRPHAASLTLCKAQEQAMNHRESSTFSSTSSWVINCPMLRAIRAGGQMSHPWTLMLHCQMARRCLANDKAVPLVPTIKGLTSSYQGTSSSEMPWTAKWSQRVVLEVG